MLEQFLEERVCRHPYANFGSLYVESTRDMRVGGENKGVWSRYARLHDIECKIVDAGVVGRLADIWNNEGHEEFLHRFLEGVKLVNGLGGFGITADGVTGFGRVEHKAVVFEGRCGEFDDSCLRILRMNFKTHGRMS